MRRMLTSESKKANVSRHTEQTILYTAPHFSVRHGLIFSICGVILLVLGLISSWQVNHWRNDKVLWQYSISVDPSDWRSHMFLSDFFVKEGDTDECNKHLQLTQQNMPKTGISLHPPPPPPPPPTHTHKHMKNRTAGSVPI